jgi:hypothetical protein
VPDVVVARRPHHHHHLVVELANGLPTGFAVVDPVVFDREARTGEDVGGVFEVEASFSERVRPFLRVVGDAREAPLPAGFACS